MSDPIDGGRWSTAGVVSLVLHAMFAIENIVVLLAVAKKRIQKADDFKQLTIADFFIMNISISDMMHGLMVSSGYLVTGANFFNSQTMCDIITFNTSVFAGTSCIFLFILAYSRYKLIMDPLHIGMTWRSAFQLAAVPWLFLLLVKVPTVVVEARPPMPSGLICMGLFTRESAATALHFIITAMIIFVPTIGIFWFYVKIVREVKKNVVNNDMSSHILRRLATLCVVLNVAFIVGMTPLGVSLSYTFVTGKYPSWQLDTVAFLFTTFNFMVNPIAYCGFQRRYREAVFDLIGISYVKQKIHDSATSTTLRKRSFTASSDSAPDFKSQRTLTNIVTMTNVTLSYPSVVVVDDDTELASDGTVAGAKSMDADKREESFSKSVDQSEESVVSTDSIPTCADVDTP